MLFRVGMATSIQRDRRRRPAADRHHQAAWLANAVLGGQDGLVNALGVILGLVAAGASARMVLVAGVAAAVAQAASMASVAYTSTLAQGDLYKAERAREYRHIEAMPDLEREEIRDIYRRKGFSGPLLERVVETITENKDVWVAVMMAEEHGLQDVDRRRALGAAAGVGSASLVGSLLPLAPFLLASTSPAALASVVVAAVALFAFGAYKARVTVGRPVKSGFELAAIGTLSALLGYGIGALSQLVP